MAPETPPPFKLSYTGPARAYMAELVHSVTGSRAAEIAIALRALELRLQNDPHILGEETYELRAIGMQIRMAAIAPVFITYGVNTRERIAIVRSMEVLDSQRK